MVGTVFLRTDRFEVKLEGITFKLKEFESLCSMDFLFPDGRVWIHRPIVGVDVMRHPRDPNTGLLLLCLGIGCVIIRFHKNETLPGPITKFLTDERICFVGFGVHEKNDLFPFEKLGLTKTKTDVGYLAAKHLNDSKLKKCELAELARRVLRINKMVGLTEAWSYERHEQIKIRICELFISSIMAITLLHPKDKNKLVDSKNKSLAVNKMDLFKFPKFQTKTSDDDDDDDVWFKSKDKDGAAAAGNNDSGNVVVSSAPPAKKPLKGILKAPSSGTGCSKTPSPQPGSSPSNFKNSPPLSSSSSGDPKMRRANSKGYNVSFVDRVV